MLAFFMDRFEINLSILRNNFVCYIQFFLYKNKKATLLLLNINKKIKIKLNK
jgi:hypothetical protein